MAWLYFGQFGKWLSVCLRTKWLWVWISLLPYIHKYTPYYGIHHQRVFKSCYRNVSWLGLEATTTKFHLDAHELDLHWQLSICSYFYCKPFSVLFHFIHCLCRWPQWPQSKSHAKNIYAYKKINIKNMIY